MKKTTLATVKSFIKRELKNNNLYVRVRSEFDGMVDGTVDRDDIFKKAITGDLSEEHTLGIRGIWFVNHGGDNFREYSDTDYLGYEIYNACGNFIVAMKKLYRK